MDFQWLHDAEYPVSLPRYDQVSNHVAVSNSTDFHLSHAIDYSITDPIPYFLIDGENDEVDIESISVSRLDIEMRPVSQQDLLIPKLEPIQQNFIDESYHVNQMEPNQPVEPEANWKNADSLCTNSSLQDWRYIQYSNSFGDTYRLAVNNEKEEKKHAVEQINTQYVLPAQHDSTKLYQLLNGNAVHAECSPPINENKEPELTELVVLEIQHPDSEKCDTFPPCEPEPTEKMMVDDGPSNLELALEVVEEKQDGALAVLMGSPILVEQESSAKLKPIANNKQTSQEGSEPAISSSATQVHFKVECNAVGPLPSNPVAVLTNPAKPEIGPYCTAVGIFANDLTVSTFRNIDGKLPADQLKNGLVFEIYSHMNLKVIRKVLVKVLWEFFDIPSLKWDQPKIVDAFFRKAVTPMITKRRELDKPRTVTRTSVQTKWNFRNKCNPEMIPEFDAAVFTIPPEVYEPSSRPVKVNKKMNGNIGKKPTQGQQLLEIQTRFDTFRRKQRKKNVEYLRHISKIQRQVEFLKRCVPFSKHQFLARRRSIL